MLGRCEGACWVKTRDDIQGEDQSLRLSREILDVLPGGVVHVGVDGAILAANQEALGILGFTFDEITRRFTQDWEPETVWEDGSPCLTQDYPVTRALVTGEPQSAVTIGVRRPNGATRWCVFEAVPVKDTAGGVSGAVVTLMDISAHKLAKDKLRESEALLKTVLNHAPSMIIATDLKATIRFVNRTSPGLPEEITTESVIGSSIYDFINRADHAMVRAALERVVETRKPETYELKGLEGFDPNWYSTRVGPVLGEGGRVEGFLLVVTNINEQRAAAAEREQWRKRLDASQRLEALGRLAGGIAHDFNNLLTVIIGNVDLLQPRLAGQDGERSVRSIERAAQRAAAMTRQLLAFSRQQELESALVDMNDVVAGLVEMLSRLLGEEVDLVFEPTEGIGVVHADRIQLERVIVNLATNARDAMPDGGRITIRTREGSDSWVIVDVIDTGEGLDEAMKSVMFEPFFTTKGPGEGTGLGLSTVHGIVRQTGGELEVESRPGEGTRISVKLPCCGEADTTASPEAMPRENTRRRASILLVEDAPAVRSVTKRILIEGGYDVEDFGSAGELDAARLGPGYDLLLTDVAMPGTNGPELAARLMKHVPGIKVLLMSGYTEESIRDRGLDTKEVAFIGKPFTAEKLLEAVRDVLER
jgi:PAS domain S-box-containing protein